MLSGRIGVFETGTVDCDLVADAASSMAVDTGTFVSSRQPAGTQPCFEASASIAPLPSGSRWTTHHPLAREIMMKLSPLVTDSVTFSEKEGYLHDYIKLILLFSHVWINCHSI